MAKFKVAAISNDSPLLTLVSKVALHIAHWAKLVPQVIRKKTTIRKTLLIGTNLLKILIVWTN